MEETNENLITRAEKLFRQGLMRSQSSNAGEDLQGTARDWQEAMDLYRKAGAADKAAELKAMLDRLSARLLKFPDRVRSAAAAAAEQDEYGEAPPSFWRRKIKWRKFKEWHVFFTVGCFGFGGPFAVWSLLHDELVKRRTVLTNKDFLEAAVMGEILPGPVTMDIVTYAGYKLDEWWGAAIATFLFIFPSFLVMLFIASHYDQYAGVPIVAKVLHALGAAVTGIIISVGLKLTGEQVKTYMETGIFLFAFISSLVFEFDMMAVILLAGVAGLLLEVVAPEKTLAKEAA